MKRLFAILVSAGIVTALAAGCSSGDDAQTGEDANLTTVPPSGSEALPEETFINGFSIGGEEYWPYKEPEPIYPDKVLWGFDSGSDPARKCMADSIRALADILQDPPQSLLELREKHGIDSFFMWNNDYTGAPRDGMGRFRRIWLYERSLIKWISETNKDGTCGIMTRDDLDRFATRCLTAFPGC